MTVLNLIAKKDKDFDRERKNTENKNQKCICESMREIQRVGEIDRDIASERERERIKCTVTISLSDKHRTDLLFVS